MRSIKQLNVQNEIQTNKNTLNEDAKFDIKCDLILNNSDSAVV